MKVSRVISGGKEVLVEIADDGAVTVIGSPVVHVRVPYRFGAVNEPASVQKGMLVVTVTPNESPGMLKVVMEDQQQAIFRNGLSLVLGISERGGVFVPSLHMQ